VFGAKAQPASFLGDFCNKIGTKRTSEDGGSLVRFRATADRHARVASTAVATLANVMFLGTQVRSWSQYHE